MNDIAMILEIVLFIGIMFLCMINRICAIVGLFVMNEFIFYTLFIECGNSFAEGLVIILFFNILVGNVFPDIYLRAFTSASTSELFKIQDKLNRKKNNNHKSKADDDMDFVLDEKENIIWLHK